MGSEILKLKEDLKSKASTITSLNAQIDFMKTDSDNPIKLSPIQEAEIEAIFQSALSEVNAKPLTFYIPGKKVDISALHFIENVFSILAKGDRMNTIRAIREVTGKEIVACKNMIDNALRAFNCDLTENNSPKSVKK